MVEIFHRRNFSHNSKNAINLELATLLKDAFIEHGGVNLCRLYLFDNDVCVCYPYYYYRNTMIIPLPI